MHAPPRPGAWLAITALTAVAVAATTAVAAAAPPVTTERPVYAVEDLRAGDGPPPPVGTSTLMRTDRGLWARLHTSQLPPRHAMTLWWVVFNDPDACKTSIPGLSRCGPADAHGGRGGVSVLHAAGRFADAGGGARFGAHVSTGDTSRALAGPGVVAPHDAIVFLVLKSHGLRIDGMTDAQLRTFGGGCADRSDAPPQARPELVGPRGGNDCAELQFSPHAPA